jgi:hypothetical protein
MGFCKNWEPEEVPDFDKEAFIGHWYEIYRDSQHNFFSD